MKSFDILRNYYENYSCISTCLNKTLSAPFMFSVLATRAEFAWIGCTTGKEELLVSDVISRLSICIPFLDAYPAGEFFTIGKTFVPNNQNIMVGQRCYLAMLCRLST